MTREGIRRMANEWGDWVRAHADDLAAAYDDDSATFAPGAALRLREAVNDLDFDQARFALVAAMVSVARERAKQPRQVGATVRAEIGRVLADSLRVDGWIITPSVALAAADALIRRPGLLRDALGK